MSTPSDARRVWLALLAVTLVVGAVWWAPGPGGRDAAPTPSAPEAAAPPADATLEPTTLSSDAARVATREGAAEGAAALPPTPSPDLPAAASGATLCGFVVAPDGTPVADAEVALGTLPDLVATKRAAGLRTAKTDGEGWFRFDAVTERAVRLTAAHPDHAPSETLAVRLHDRAPDDELVLHLRRGAVVRGEVFRPDRAPAVARRVQLASDFGGGMRVVETDERGMFTIAHVAPGRWSVATFPGKEEMTALEALGFQGPDLMHLRQKMFELADGEDVFVSLGAPAARAVRVFGQVTSGGAPREVLMQWLSERSRSLELQKIARSSADGAYEVVVDEPGPYLVRLHTAAGAGASVDELVEVPLGVTELRHDIGLATAVVRGRVLDVDGAPLAGLTVTYRCLHGPWRAPLTTMSASVTTDAAGAFEVRQLPAGEWSFAASRPYAKPDDGPALAPVPTGPVDVAEGAVVEGVEVRVTRGAALTGRCVDEYGLGLRGAALLVFDDAGRALQAYTPGASGADGAFSGPIVGPGAHTVIAVRGHLVSEATSVAAAIEDRGSLEVTLQAGAALVVRFPHARAAWTTSVDVVDAAGRSYRDLVPHTTSQLDYLAGYRPGVQRFAPLPPGSYSVRIGAGVAHEVSLAPGEDLVLELGS